MAEVRADQETARPAIVRVDAPTEQRNPASADIDRLPTLEVLRVINAEDQRVAPAIQAVLPRLAEAVEWGVAALRGGHQVHYFGAGTPGRLAVLDAAELPPTFSLPEGRVVAHHAGGPAALTQAVEGAEDDEAAGVRAAAQLAAGDLAIGLSASGRTPYVAGALRAASAAGAATVLISANPTARLGGEVDLHLAVDTGPEVLTGSTRMKAGTAQKLVLGAFSTALMIRLGHTYGNLMVAVRPTNAKLRGRAITILTEATGAPTTRCQEALAAAGGDPRLALVCLLSGADLAGAQVALAEAGGVVRDALARLGRQS